MTAKKPATSSASGLNANGLPAPRHVEPYNCCNTIVFEVHILGKWFVRRRKLRPFVGKRQPLDAIRMLRHFPPDSESVTHCATLYTTYHLKITSSSSFLTSFFVVVRLAAAFLAGFFLAGFLTEESSAMNKKAIPHQSCAFWPSATVARRRYCRHCTPTLSQPCASWWLASSLVKPFSWARPSFWEKHAS